ncbi:MAG: peptidoglycan DD-metalloendopeptidase family protein [Pseudomonadota bacterium]|nr:peptidoglycan DD-metalloendopeptidase family protein [Pseudomonadota bacterium]
MSDRDPAAGTAHAAVEPAQQQYLLKSHREDQVDRLIQQMAETDVEVDEAPAPREIDAVIRPGDTLARALTDAGVDNASAHLAVSALGDLTDLRRLKPGQALTMVFDADDDRLTEIRLRESVERTVVARRDAGSDGFSGEEILAELDKGLVKARGTIDDSLFLAASRAGVEHDVLMEFIRIFSYDVDFQREIHPGDGFDLVWERFTDENGEMARTGNVLVATLTLSGKARTFYRFQPKGEARADYYDRTGQSVRKTLMRTPIDGARITSGFGKRRHPILGYTKVHKGIDFGASPGTPIKAAGDGTVEVLGWNGAYGRYIRIRHNGSYSTAYAHMQAFRGGLKKGSRVDQGQVIGYVGTSGRSTGPHLHYEVMKDGKQVNPLSIKLPTGIKLEGAQLAAFRSFVARQDSMIAALPWQDEVAGIDAETAGPDEVARAAGAPDDSAQ